MIKIVILLCAFLSFPLLAHGASDVYTSTDLLTNPIPIDGSPVSASEGTEVLSVVFAASSDTAEVTVRFSGSGTHAVSDNALVAALFIDGDATARRVGFTNPAGPGYAASFSLEYSFVPGDTNPRTYKIRVGSSSGSMRLNAYAGPLSFGGSAGATLSVTETDDDVAAKGQWRMVAEESPWSPRDGAGLVSYRGDLYLLGGWNPARFPTTNNEVWKSSDDGKTWQFLHYAPWQGRHTVGWGVFNDQIVVIGGDVNQSTYISDIWTFDPENGWLMAAISAPWNTYGRGLFQTVILEDRILIIGGQTLDEFVIPQERANLPNPFFSDVWETTDLVNWIKLSDNNVFAPRSTIVGQAVLDGRVYLIGGGQYETSGYPRAYSSTIYSAPLTDLSDWRAEPAPPWGGRNYPKLVVYKDEIWMIGGHDGADLAEVWRWKPGTPWRQSNAPWAPRHAASATVHNSEIILLGGPLDKTAVWAMN